MKVTMKTVLPMTAVSLFALSASAKSVERRAFEYAQESNRTKEEVLNIIKAGSPAIQQAKLDSLAFRDVFNQTQGSKSTYNVTQFESLAKKMSNFAADETERNPEIKYDMDSYNKSEKSKNEAERYQFFIDTYQYSELFKKMGISSQEVRDEINRVSKIIKPD